MINTRFKRLLSMLMCVVMCVTSPCTSVFAYTDFVEEEIFEDVDEEIWDSFPEEESSNEELLEGYMLQEAEAIVNESKEEMIREEVGDVYVERGVLLSGYERFFYDALKEKIKLVAKGKLSYTKFYIPLPESLRKDYTAEMLGVSKLYENGSITAEAENAMKGQLYLDFKKIVRSLMMDMPYELYWFDKVKGYGFLRDVTYKHKIQNGVESLSYSNPSDYEEPCWRIYFYVSRDYSVSGKQETCDFNTTLAQKAAKAAAKAAEDVLHVAESVSSDYAKLCEYRKLIKNYSGYNSEAANTSKYPYGDPWQMIHVFDDDPTTKVVCEGFSKAFKFMCDISSFAGDIDCSLVSGFMGTKPYNPEDSRSTPGSHMWNNLRMEDGKIYLIDVTNAGSDYAANFLGGAEYRSNIIYPKTSDADGSYTTNAYSCGGYYYYFDKLTMNLYDDSELIYNTVHYNSDNIKYTCNVTLSMNYAEGGRKLVSVYKNEDAKEKLLAEKPIRKGYAFEGWYTISDNRISLDDLPQVVVSENNCIFCAKWRELDKYPVTAHLEKGAFSDGSIIKTELMYAGLPFYEAFEVPILDHYSFTGWYIDESCSANSLIKENELFEIEKSRDIYAGWKIKRYSLTLKLNGGEFSNGSTKDLSITYNALTSLSNPSKYIPLRAGYDFEGWYTDQTEGELYDISQPITKSITLYAHWKIKQVINHDDDDVSENKTTTPSENETEQPEQPVKPDIPDIPDKPETVSVNGFYACFDEAGMYKDGIGNYHIEYAGSKLSPHVCVYDNKKLLTEGVDYSVKYVNNLNAYEKSGKPAYAEIRGKANLSGSYKLYFLIDRKDINEVVSGNLCVREGQVAKADPVLMHNGKKLNKKKDYSLVIKGNTAELAGEGNYRGNMSLPLEVLSASEYSERAIKVKLNATSFSYDGSEKTLKDKSNITVIDKNGRYADYAVSYSANVNAGTVKVTICGIGKNHGFAKKTFRIKPCKVKGSDSFKIRYPEKLSYRNGGTKPEAISVNCVATGEILTEGKDYKLKYSNYKKCGTAKVKITFKGNYKGSAYPVLKYTITKCDLTDARVYAGDKTYTKPGIYCPRVALAVEGSFVSPKEYRLEYMDDLKTEEPVLNLALSLTAKEKNYSGSTGSISYNIVSNGIDINKARIVFAKGADKQSYEGRGERVTLVPGKDFKLKINKYIQIDDAAELENNFNFIYTDNMKKGTAYIIVVPKTDKYTGLTIGKFKIKAADVKDLIE